MIKILVAHDFPIVREGLKETLEEIPDLGVDCESSQGEMIFEVLSRKKIDMLIMDIFPGEGGLETLKSVKRLYPNVAILIFTRCREDKFALRALKSGAAGYLTQDSGLDEIIKAVRKVSSGGKYFSATPFVKWAEHLN